jgi:hypothetical protein
MTTYENRTALDCCRFLPPFLFVDAQLELVMRRGGGGC